MNSTVAMVLAGGKQAGLAILARRRAKAAVPFGGGYRVIDFVLTNLSHTSINHVGIISQHLPESLMDHLKSGHPWGFDSLDKEIKLLPPYLGRGSYGWYKSTADALYQNLDFITKYSPDLVLVLSGDHIYQMNYEPLLDYHRKKNADITVVVKLLGQIPPARYGVMRLDMENRVKTFEEKSTHPQGNFISLGIYVFNRPVLEKYLLKSATSQQATHQISTDILDPAVKTSKVYGYPFEGRWEYLATIEEYWRANLSLLNTNTAKDLMSWKLRTNPDDRSTGDRPPVRFGIQAKVDASIIGDGAIINGTVRRSVIFPGVVVEPGAVVEESVVMHDSVIGSESRLRRLVVDKDVTIGRGCSIGFGNPKIANRNQPHYFDKGITVLAKSVVIPDNSTIGCNCIIDSGFCGEGALSVDDGETLG